VSILRKLGYLVRWATDPEPLVGSLRAAVAEVYSAQPIYNITTLAQSMGEQLAPRRQLFLLLARISHRPSDFAI